MGSGSSNAGQGQAQLSPTQLVDIYNQALPPSLATVMNQVPTSVNTIANAATSANPIYTAGGLDQLQQYAGGYQQAGAGLAQQQAQSQAELLAGAGGSAAMTADALSRAVNPNYYDVQDTASAKYKELLDSVNLKGLSPGEQNAVERSLNQSNVATNNLGLDNATNAVSNAMNFGDRYQTKQMLTNSILQTAPSLASSAQNTSFNPVTTALGAGDTSKNFGLGQFNPTQANNTVQLPINAATGFGSTLGGNASSTNSGNTGASTSVLGGCCFIVLEAYHGQMPECVRKCRDRYYRVLPEVANGYKKMANWLVPMMKQSPIVRALVWHLMVKPLTEYGSFIMNRTENKGKWARRFWFTVWKNL